MSTIDALLGELQGLVANNSNNANGEQIKALVFAIKKAVEEEEEKRKKIEQELFFEKAKPKISYFNIKFLACSAILCNVILFPFINFIAKCIDINAPQIHLDIEPLIKMLLPFFGTGG